MINIINRKEVAILRDALSAYFKEKTKLKDKYGNDFGDMDELLSNIKNLDCKIEKIGEILDLCED